MQLVDFKVLTFDCYGTLIDWETGLYAALQPLLSRAGRNHDRDAVLEQYGRLEQEQQEATPAMRYSELLAQVHARLSLTWGVQRDADEGRRFGGSIPDWPAFPDSASALAYLKQHYALVILSNVDRAGFAASNRRLGVDFDAVYTAEDVGSYKPDPRNFSFMLARLAERGFDKSDVLHTAQSLHHDHAPANAIGLASAWIDRRHGRHGHGATPGTAHTPRYDFRFLSLSEMASAHAKELRNA